MKPRTLVIAWIAFSLSFVFANLSYVWPVLSDPFGWGWNLLGTAASGWTPYLMGVIPSIQTVILLAGLAWAARTALRIACEQVDEKSAVWQAAPVIVFCMVVTGVLLRLMV